MSRILRSLSAAAIMAAFSVTTLATLSGCDNKEDVLEIETPDGRIDVERDTETDAIDVDVD